ncbi:transcription factor bHLH100-like isoform X2 [Lotus japonicus]|uniref:transcription factor bHLH100-like isoform X2 n=1 Tax=Lotus japonicus TaxID=34305 RepID=UPI00258A97B5|nr:transcription factor bHLH100-like isoform X2 [Lotus japonicus]
MPIMLVEFPITPFFSYSNMDCLLEEDPFISQNQDNYFNKDSVSSPEYSFPQQFSSPQPQVEVENSSSLSPDTTMVKKLSHNASERDRRKKINSLIASLRSLLPGPDQTKKMSIPATISQVIKYIPELQKQVKGLTKKKEKLLSKTTRQRDAVNEESQRKKIPHHNPDFVVSNSWLNDTEAAIHISSYEAHHKTPLSEILLCLENNGYLLLNASSTKTFGGRIFYNLHFQVEKTQRLEADILTQKLLSIYEKKQRMF